MSDIRHAFGLSRAMSYNRSPLYFELIESLIYFQFLSKQVATMKEENLNRSKFYEQLENSLDDLERTNEQLIQKSELDKKRILRYGQGPNNLNLDFH